MPYISNKMVYAADADMSQTYPRTDREQSQRREVLRGFCSYCEGESPRPPVNAGELAYVLTDRIEEYVEQVGWSYQTANDVVGALEGLKHEFQRRFVDPYEDYKRTTNGEVFQRVIQAMDAAAREDGLG